MELEDSDSGWSDTKITYAIVFKGNMKDILQFKSDLSSIIPPELKVIYQKKSGMPLYITDEN